MSFLKDFTLKYSDVSIEVGIADNGNDISTIKYTYESTPRIMSIDWNEIAENMTNPKSNMVDTISHHLENLPNDDYTLLSSTSVTSLSLNESKTVDSNEYLVKNYARGFVIVFILSELICQYKYINIKMLSLGDTIYSRSYLKILRMAIIIHSRCVDSDNKLLKHGLDFINRWSLLFKKGDSLDKTEALLELVANYLCSSKPNRDIEIDVPLEKRVVRLESFLGLN